MLRLFIINLLLALAWPALGQNTSGPDFLIGFVVGLALLSLFQPEYGRRAYYLATFIPYVLWQILVSNFILAYQILRPNPDFSPGIVGVPLEDCSDLEITVLATIITLTPGTLSVDVDRRHDHGAEGHHDPTLYVHSIFIDDPEAFRREIKHKFERRILRITRPELPAHLQGEAA